MLLTFGADIYTTSKLLGHAKVNTSAIYAKIVDPPKKKKWKRSILLMTSFQNNRKRRETDENNDTLEAVCVEMAAAVGIEKNVSFHTQPPLDVYAVIGSRGDLYTVGKLFGHTNINSTHVYVDVVMKTKIEAVYRISEYFSM